MYTQETYIWYVEENLTFTCLQNMSQFKQNMSQFKQNISSFFFYIDEKCAISLEKLRLMTFLERRMRDDLIKTFKIINGISNYGRQFFNISPQTGKLLSKQISKTESIN